MEKIIKKIVEILKSTYIFIICKQIKQQRKQICQIQKTLHSFLTEFQPIKKPKGLSGVVNLGRGMCILHKFITYVILPRNVELRGWFLLPSTE